MSKLQVDITSPVDEPEWVAELVLDDQLVAEVRHAPTGPAFSFWVERRRYEVPLAELMDALERVRAEFEREAEARDPATDPG